MSNGTSDPQGWRIAGLVVALALALTAGAYAIHTKVYCDPRHPECVKARAAAEHGADADHGTDAAHGADASHGTTPPATHDTSHSSGADRKAQGDTSKSAPAPHKSGG